MHAATARRGCNHREAHLPTAMTSTAMFVVFAIFVMDVMTVRTVSFVAMVSHDAFVTIGRYRYRYRRLSTRQSADQLLLLLLLMTMAVGDLASECDVQRCRCCTYTRHLVAWCRWCLHMAFAEFSNARR
jgi:hypothetical protein